MTNADDSPAGFHAKALQERFAGCRVVFSTKKAGTMAQHGILIVEDEPLVRHIVAADFEDEGFLVYQAESSDDALDLLKERSDIQILFTDIRIPGKFDGVGLLEQVFQRWPHLLLMATSGHFRPDREALPGQAHFIAKPFVTSAVIDEAKALIAQSGL